MESDPPQPGFFGRGFLFGVMILLCAVSLYLCYRAIRVMERAVTVMEAIDAKVDRAIAVAPSAAQRAKELADGTDAEHLGEIAKSKATSVGQKAKEWLAGKSQGK